MFRTDYKGWGVRALAPLGAGEFVCEYVAEMLTVEEADRRMGRDEYMANLDALSAERPLFFEVSRRVPTANAEGPVST